MLNFFGDLCGYVYISSFKFVYYCVLCEKSFQLCTEFKDHILKDHYQFDFAESHIEESGNNVNNLPVCDLYTNLYKSENDMETIDEQCDLYVNSQQEILNLDENFEQTIEIKIEQIEEHDFISNSASEFNFADDESLKSSSSSNCENGKNYKGSVQDAQQINKPEHQIDLKLFPYDLNDLDDTNMKCKYCGKFFKKTENLIQHTKDHLNYILTCNICGKHSTKKSSAEIHKKSHVKFNCNMCDKRFSNKVLLELHFKRHDSLKCQYCSRIFKKKDVLQNHLRTHTGEKPFRCHVCGHGFALKKNLQSHIFTQHTGDIKNFSCNFCGRKFKTKRLQDFHIKRVHLKEKPNQCEFCGIHFANTSGLTRHKLKLHTEYNKRPHHCALCDKKFVELRNLTEHMNTHTGKKPFQCDICLKSFGQRRTLRQHKKLHSDKKSYICKLCHKSFAQYAGLANHNKRYHLVYNENKKESITIS